MNNLAQFFFQSDNNLPTWQPYFPTLLPALHSFVTGLLPTLHLYFGQRSGNELQN
jgi:hypothetical protein